MICSIPLIRYIYLREEIQIVHGHSAFSALAHEGMLIGRLMGLKVSYLKFKICNIHILCFFFIGILDYFYRSFTFWLCGCICNFNK